MASFKAREIEAYLSEHFLPIADIAKQTGYSRMRIYEFLGLGLIDFIKPFKRGIFIDKRCIPYLKMRKQNR